MDSLTQLTKERPVIYDVLGHYLHQTELYIREYQNLLYHIVSMIKESNYTIEFPLFEEMKVIIYISAKATLYWLRTNLSHAWYKPILRLLKVLDENPNVPPEPQPPMDAIPVFENGKYMIKHGCRVLTDDNQYCNGNMYCIDWHGEPISPFSMRKITYVCNKCGNVKMV